MQLSQVYSDYGYEPKAGATIATVPAVVTGSLSRAVYTPPVGENAPEGRWSVMEYVVSDGASQSAPGTVWFLPPHGRLAGSGFALGTDGWAVVQNGAAAGLKLSGGLRWEAYFRGGGLSHFVAGSDEQVLPSSADGGEDRSRWAFAAPASFLGNQAGAYGGAMELVLGSSAGDFSLPARASADARIVTLSCASCDVGAGIRLAFFANASVPLDGKTRRIRVPLVPGSWRKDPRNSILPWGATTACELADVLGALTGVEVLGDHTRGYETVALDDVALVRGAGPPVGCLARA